MCCVHTRQQFSASLDYFVTNSPPYLHQFSTISGGNCIKMTVVWHVDDLKVLHVDATEVERFVQQMEEAFGQETPLTVSWGQVHDYLGMTLDFRTKGEVQISMEHYIDMMLQDAPEEMKGTAMTPAAPHLFKVNKEDTQLLGPEKKKIFVHLVMRGLYLSQPGYSDSDRFLVQ